MNLNLTIKKFDLFQYLQQHSVDFKVCGNGKFYYMTCWACGKRKLFIHAGNNDNYKGFWRCWVCSTKGDIFDLVAETEAISRKSAIAKILGAEDYNPTDLESELRSQIQSWIKEDAIETNGKIVMPPNFKKVVELGPHSDGYKYALKRGLTIEDMEYFDIRYAGTMKRIVFPIYYKDDLVGWQARDITGQQEPKVLSSSDFKKSIALYNYDNVCESTSIMVVEGPIDAIKARRFNPVALLGKAISKVQMGMILQLPYLKDINIALDPDASAHAEQLAGQLDSVYKVKILKLPRGRDIGDSSQAEIKHYLDIARPFGNQLVMENLL